MARILIVEDEVTLARALRQGLTDELHIVDVVHDGEEGLWAARTGAYDLLILDWMLPGLLGTQICRRVRAESMDVAILVLTAKDRPTDVVRGLDAGADDYVTKPFRFEELLARVRALLRSHARAFANLVVVGGLRVDLRAHRAWRDGDELTLTAQETRLLECLALHAEQIVSRSRLTDALWSHDDDPESNVLDVLISSLRRKLRRDGEPQLIHTARGLGYALKAPAQ